MHDGSLRALLTVDHARLEWIFTELMNAVEGADQPTLQQAWTDFESGLLRHLEAEERLIVPALEVEHPEEIRMLRRDHARIRGLIAELGVSTDLHLLRSHMAEELLQRLRSHARWEDETLYRWAEEAIDETGRRSLFETLKQRLGK